MPLRLPWQWPVLFHTDRTSRGSGETVGNDTGHVIDRSFLH